MLTSRSGESDQPTLHSRRSLVLLASFDEVLRKRPDQPLRRPVVKEDEHTREQITAVSAGNRWLENYPQTRARRMREALQRIC
jgi:hypothetical protein